MISSVVKIIRGIVKLRGDTDDTLIGNVGDRLKVDAAFSGNVPFPSMTNKVMWDDMNATTGGVARDTLIGSTFTNVYSHSGSGFLFGFLITLEEEKKWAIQLNVDGVDLFIGAGGILTNDLDNDNIYGFKFKIDDKASEQTTLGFSLKKNTVFFETSHPIRFTSNVTIKVKKADGGDKKFRAGLVMIHKD